MSRLKQAFIQPVIKYPIPSIYETRSLVRQYKIVALFNLLEQNNILALDVVKLYEFAAYFEDICYITYSVEIYPAAPFESKNDDTWMRYHGLVDTLAARLQEPSLNIFNRIIRQEITVADVFGLQIADLQPEKTIKIQKIIDETTRGLSVRYIKGYTCSNCKEQKMIPSLSNHRSIDEGSVTKLTCATCGKSRFL
jgi:RNase P subunit RPR2